MKLDYQKPQRSGDIHAEKKEMCLVVGTSADLAMDQLSGAHNHALPLGKFVGGVCFNILDISF